MTAKINHLEETLPKVPADPPRERITHRGPSVATRTAGKMTPRQIEVEEIVVAASRSLESKGHRQSKSVAGFAASSLYRLVASRVDMSKYAKDPEQELLALQQTLSLLTWELGTTLDDIRLSEPAKTKGTKS